MSKIPLDSSDCEILSLLKRFETLSGIHLAIGLDKSYLSRRLQKIADTAPVLIKVQSKWQLTPKGVGIVDWFDQAIQKQRQILVGKEDLVFGTTQTISERKLIQLLPEVLAYSGFKTFTISTSYKSAESALLSGDIDFAFVCGIPNSPEIRFKRIVKWPYVVVLPFDWNDHFKNVSELLAHPYVSHTGIEMRLVLGMEHELPAPSARFDHLIGVREAVINGVGWAIVPLYAVEREIQFKKMKRLKHQPLLSQNEEFQLWWVPGRMDKKTVNGIVEKLIKQLTCNV